MLNTDIKNSLYNSFSKLMPSTPIIFAKQGGAEPKAPYCSINLLQSVEQGMPYTATYANSSPAILTRVEYELYTRLIFVGKDSSDLAAELHLALGHPATRFIFATNSLSLMEYKTIKSLNEKRDTTWIELSTLDVVFSYAAEITQQIDIIETVDFTSNITP